MKTVEGLISVYSGVQEGRAKAGVGGGSICLPPLLFSRLPLRIHQALSINIA